MCGIKNQLVFKLRLDKCELKYELRQQSTIFKKLNKISFTEG